MTGWRGGAYIRVTDGGGAGFGLPLPPLVLLTTRCGGPGISGVGIFVFECRIWLGLFPPVF